MRAKSDVFVRTMPGQAAGVTRYLNSMIFWQDEVEVADLTAEIVQFALYGPERVAPGGGTGQQLGACSRTSWRTATLGGAACHPPPGGPLEAPPGS